MQVQFQSCSLQFRAVGTETISNYPSQDTSSDTVVLFWGITGIFSELMVSTMKIYSWDASRPTQIISQFIWALGMKEQTTESNFPLWCVVYTSVGGICAHACTQACVCRLDANAGCLPHSPPYFPQSISHWTWLEVTDSTGHTVPMMLSLPSVRIVRTHHFPMPSFVYSVRNLNWDPHAYRICIPSLQLQTLLLGRGYNCLFL